MTIQTLKEKWATVLEHKDLESIGNAAKSGVIAQLLENTETALKESTSWDNTSSLLNEEPTNAASNGQITNYDPVLISLVRRSMPNLIAFDIAGVQPMTGPTGLIFALRSKYAVDPANTASWNEAMYNESDTDFSGAGTHAGVTGTAATANTGTGMTTAAAEALGDGTAPDFAEMSFSVEKISVVAKSRALKAEYTTELAQDLKAIHGLDAETELSNILTAEVLSEINRELIRTVYTTATAGSQDGVATAGTFDLDVDANGRWSVEKFKGLMFQIEREANKIAKDTRRGKANIIICSSDVASALQMAGVLDYTPALTNKLNVDDTGNTFAGLLNGRFKVYIDPYAGGNYLVVGYKGASSFDAGLFYCPYVPLQMVRAIGENSFQPKIGFKTRYGMVANPYSSGATASDGSLTAGANIYYRRTLVSNIL
ncbi:MAG: ATP-binding protein [Robiginitomaculum sp.]|nr:MAG: ATP-binding protein [Robiginitomaculum sp.]